MAITKAMEERHSVRRYQNKPLESDVVKILEEEIEKCNKEGGLHIQLVKDEPKAFDCFMAHYGKFSGVTNYIALVGKKSPDLDEKCGYYGERLVLKAQEMGLNTCWVAMSYKKVPGTFKVEKGEKITVVISIGYGEKQGRPHESKPAESVSNISESSPEWFKVGVKASLLAPTAMNQQKFRFEQNGNKVTATAGTAFYSKVDLGIAKYHFETAAGKENFEWA